MGQFSQSMQAIIEAGRLTKAALSRSQGKWDEDRQLLRHLQELRNFAVTASSKSYINVGNHRNMGFEKLDDALGQAAKNLCMLNTPGFNDKSSWNKKTSPASVSKSDLENWINELMESAREQINLHKKLKLPDD
ncbi:hypothetical protein HYY74_07075 [Candidatus Woesearchaeota archaeon]|nr:hypothetical protein [Candidatus Woesearchaeota archaeon]